MTSLNRMIAANLYAVLLAADNDHIGVAATVHQLLQQPTRPGTDATIDDLVIQGEVRPEWLLHAASAYLAASQRVGNALQSNNLPDAESDARAVIEAVELLTARISAVADPDTPIDLGIPEIILDWESGNGKVQIRILDTRQPDNGQRFHAFAIGDDPKDSIVSATAGPYLHGQNGALADVRVFADSLTIEGRLTTAECASVHQLTRHHSATAAAFVSLTEPHHEHTSNTSRPAAPTGETTADRDPTA